MQKERYKNTKEKTFHETEKTIPAEIPKQISKESSQEILEKLRRMLAELNLLDDFLFFKMLNHPEFGEAFSKALLEAIFQRKFGRLRVIPQKVYYGSDVDKHGARLDVYLEEGIENDTVLTWETIYDVEADLKNTEKDKKTLPKRMRFYHSIIDADSLKSGMDYSHLKKVVVIMITPFDPFGYDHMIYTIKNSCMEIPDLPYDDGARTIFLYTKGKKGDVSKELREFLEYMEDTREENVKNETLENIHKMVEIVKRDKGVTLEYMKIFEREQMLREQGREWGREEGREEERANTERERQRADFLEAKLKELLGEDSVFFKNQLSTQTPKGNL